MEEALLVLAGLALLFALVLGVILPIVALVKVSTLRRELENLKLNFEAWKRAETGKRQAPESTSPRVAAPAASPTPASTPDAVPTAGVVPAPVETAPPAVTPAAVVTAVTPIPTAFPVEAPVEEPAKGTVPKANPVPEANAAPPPGAVLPPLTPPRPGTAAGGEAPGTSGSDAPPASTIEEKIALVWFTRIGAGILILGLGYFFKYAVDNDWIGPWGRITLGVVIGAAVLAFAERGAKTTRPLWTQVALGVGLSFLFLSAYASYGFYQVVPMGVAFAAFALVAVLGGALAIQHRGEAILVLSLAAALAAPVLLSTGQDRPFALFSYLLVVTSLSHAASVRMQFRWSLWLGIVGVAVLFIGWYQKFFDNSPAPEYSAMDVSSESLEGRYLHLSARAVPLGAVVVFTLQWIGVAWQARVRDSKVGALAVLVAATLLAHAGFAALLFDLPLHLGGVLAVVAVGSAIALHREKKSELLIFPLLASFVVLLTSVSSRNAPETYYMLALLGLWASVYAVAFLRSRGGKAEEIPPSLLMAVGIVGAAFLVLTSIVLADRPIGIAVIITGVSVGFAVLGVLTRRPLVTAAASATSFIFLLIHLPGYSPESAAFLAISGGWSLVYFASAAYALVRRGEEPNESHVLIASIAGLGFAYLAMARTVPSQTLLRAALLGGVGALDLALGAVLLRGPRPSRRRASVLLGQALGLLTAATGLLFTGATVTVVWAAMAAVVVWLASEEKDSLWLAGGVLLFMVAIGRLLSVDLQQARQLQHAFFDSHGRAGELLPRFLLNTRTYALAGLSAALFIAARSASRAADRLFSGIGFVLLGVAHIGLLMLIVGEAANLIRAIPNMPKPPTDVEEFWMFEQAIMGQWRNSQMSLAMWTTLLMGLYASALVGLGFGAKSRAHRYLGLSLFAVTLGKLALWDVWRLPRILQIAVLMVVGALLLGASFLYARFGKRLVTILRDGVTPVALLVCGLAMGGDARAQGLDLTPFAWQRPINGVAGPGYYRAEVDPDLYRKSKASEGGFPDLRIVGPDGAEVPWVLRHTPIRTPAINHPATLVDPVTLPDGSTRAVFDLGKPGLKHTEIVLNLPGEDFFRRTRVEVSPDEKEWAVLAEGGVVYRAQSAASFSEQLTLRHPISDARYIRVTILAGSDRRPLVIEGGTVGYTVPASHPPTKAVRAVLLEETRDPKTKASIWKFDGGEPGVPFTALALVVQGPAFERRATLSASTAASYWSTLASSVLFRVEGSGEGIESSEFAFPEARKRYFKVEVQNGDSPPLSVAAAQLQYRVEEIVFQASQAGGHVLLVGAAGVKSPDYDLPRILERSPPSALKTATLGSFEANAAVAGKTAPEKTDPLQLPLTIVLAVVFIGLAVWTVSLLRKRNVPPS